MAGVNPNIREIRTEVPPGLEQAPGVERGRELPVRIESPQTEKVHEEAAPNAPTRAAQVPVRNAPAERQLANDIETVLEDGLGELYRSLDEATKREFKSTGEKTASKIAAMMQHTHIQVRKVLSLIASWLRIIPGISKLFVEQEAKIKTDQVLALRRGSEERADD